MLSNAQMEMLFKVPKYTKGTICLTGSTGQCEVHAQQTC